MDRLLKLGPYYFLLDGIARFYAGRHVHAYAKIGVSLLVFAMLCMLAWLGAEWFTLRSGEYPGSLQYSTLKFKYLMRLLGCEALLVSGLLFATSLARHNGRIYNR